MAKRTPSDPQAQPNPQGQPKPRRSKSTPDSQPAHASEVSTATAPVPSEAGDDAPLESMTADSQSMASEPNEEDIRMRAYHRYLERGGGHGMDFEDWLEAERELKPRS
jgi:Protein of unknown function (DUF2934)